MYPTSNVAICVATYLRPKCLGELLKSLRGLETDGLDVQLIVADNDPSGSAQSVVQHHTKDFPFPVKYIIEPNRGIASVRNRLFAEAFRLDVEFIATIDDDATADPCWLKELVASATAYNADVVGGPQIFWMDVDVPDRYRALYRTHRRVTGQQTEKVSTCNALFRRSAVILIPGPFDTRFNLTGGEDGFLSMQLSKLGKKLIECDEAIVYEYVPKTRLTTSYQMRRRFAVGANKSRIVLLDPSPIDILRQATRSTLITFAGASMLILSVLVRQEKVLVHASMVMAGLGGLMTILFPRFQFRPYQNIGGE